MVLGWGRCAEELQGTTCRLRNVTSASKHYLGDASCVCPPVSHSSKEGGTHDKETKSVNHTVSQRGRHPERGGVETGVRRDRGGGDRGRAQYTEGTALHGS